MASAIDAAIAKVDELIARSSEGAGAATTTTTTAAPAVVAAAAAAAAAPAAAAAAAAPGKAEPAAATTAAPTPGKADPGGKETIEGKANLKVARILSAEPLAGSDKLLRLQVDVGLAPSGEPDRRQIMAGLQQYLKPDDLVNKLLVIVANLKPAKLAGELSQGMVLAAEGADPSTGARIVRTLIPPAGAAPGDDVVVEGCTPAPPPPVGASKKQTEAAMMKKEAWWAAAAGLVVRGGKAHFEERPLVLANGAAAGGAVSLPAEIPDGAAIC
jgi:methionine--tRNA ligase beta chain